MAYFHHCIKFLSKCSNFRLWLWIIFLIGFSATTFAASFPETEFQSGQIAISQQPHTRAILYSSHHSVAAGDIITLAVRLEPQKDWHTYWQNAGDSGLPLTIQWQGLPEQLSIRPARWPAPERISIDPLVNFGFAEAVDVLLTAELPPTLAGDTLSFKAALNWLVCNDVCIPESAELALNLPISAVSTPPKIPVRQWFEAKEQALPVLLLSPLPLYEITDNWLLPLSPALPQKAIQSAFFFPDAAGFIAPSAPQRVSNSILVFPKDKENTILPVPITGVVRVTDFAGVSAAYNVTLTPNGSAPSDVALLASQSSALSVTEAIEPSPASLPQPSYLMLIGLALIGGLLLNIMPCVLPILSLKTLALVKLHGAGSAREARREGIFYTIGICAGLTFLALLLTALKQQGQALGWGFQLQNPSFVAVMTAILLVIAMRFSGLWHLSPALPLPNIPLYQGSHPFLTGVLAVLVATPCTVPFMAAAVGAALTMPLAAMLPLFFALGIGMALPFLLVAFSPKLQRYLPKAGAWMVRCQQFLAFPLYASSAWLLWVYTGMVERDSIARLLALGCFLGLMGWLLPQLRRRVWVILLILCSIIAIAHTARQSLPQTTTVSSKADTFSETAVTAARASGKTVLVNVTADWCLTCKLNERLVFSKPSVQQALRADNVAYFIADWTRRDADITRYLASFSRSGVPLYVVYKQGKEPILLPQVLSQKRVLVALQ